MRLLLLLVATLSLYAQPTLRDYPKARKLTQSYKAFVDQKRCQLFNWCDGPQALEEFSEWCQLWVSSKDAFKVACYNTYSSESDRECFLTFSVDQDLENVGQYCDVEFFSTADT